MSTADAQDLRTQFKETSRVSVLDPLRMKYWGALLQEGVLIDRFEELDPKKGYLHFSPGKVDVVAKRDVTAVKGTFKTTTHQLPRLGKRDRTFFGLYLFYRGNESGLQDWEVFCFGPKGSDEFMSYEEFHFHAGPYLRIDDEDDTKNIQGTWVAVDNQRNGKQSTPERIKEMAITLTINGDRFDLADATDSTGGIFKIDPTQAPKQAGFNYRFENGTFAFYPAIYELRGDTLWICRGAESGKFPTEFKTSAEGPGHHYWKFKRVR